MTQGTGDVVIYDQQFLDLAEASPDIGIHPNVDAPQFFYRPAQLLVPATEAQQLRELLVGNEALPNPDLSPELPSFPVEDVALIHLSGAPGPHAALTVPEIVDQILAQAPAIGVTPHHVVFGAGNVMGHPHTPPVPAGPVQRPNRIDPPIPFTIAICDTGIWADAVTAFSAGTWFDGLYDPNLAGIDLLYRPTTTILGLEGGHGTFIAGVIQQFAPGVRLAPRDALDAAGIGDESTVAAALQAIPPEATIVNLSLGCPTKDQKDAIGMAAAIGKLPAGTVVVAAAGNTQSTDPHYPAASPGVIGVGATATVDGVVRPADYSARGDWIKVWAPGTHTSTYVRGDFELPNTATPVLFELPWATWEGTSFAAPYVAAWIARTAAANGQTARDAANILLNGLIPTLPVGFASGVVLA